MTNCGIEYDQLYCSGFTKPWCLDIKKKITVLKKLYNLVKTLTINYDNEGKYDGVSTDFIRKLMDFFFITIGEK